MKLEDIFDINTDEPFVIIDVKSFKGTDSAGQSVFGVFEEEFQQLDKAGKNTLVTYKYIKSLDKMFRIPKLPEEAYSLYHSDMPRKYQVRIENNPWEVGKRVADQEPKPEKAKSLLADLLYTLSETYGPKAVLQAAIDNHKKWNPLENN